MDPVINLKRPLSVNYGLCIFCQTYKSRASLVPSSSKGLKKIENSTSSRRKIRDPNKIDMVDRVYNGLQGNSNKLVWHRKCYQDYTNRNKIARLDQNLKKKSSKDTISKTKKVVNSKVLRHSTKPTEWGSCIFCQRTMKKKKLSSIKTPAMSQDILDISQLDHEMNLRLAGVIDLVAKKGKYHLSCLSKFRRSVTKVKKESDSTDLAMAWLCMELHDAAEKGQVLQLKDVWERYTVLAEDSSQEIPKSFISRRSTFMEKLKRQLGDMFNFFRPFNQCITERQTLLIPAKYKHQAVSQLVSKMNDESDINLKIPEYHPQGGDISLLIFHTAMAVRSDIISTPGHKGMSVTEDDARACVPDSLYTLLELLYEGPSVLESEEDGTSVNKKALSTAQDLVYGISGGRKLTPKHIGLASTLHQVTRSKKLVHLFHEAGHCLSYEQVLKVDTALAESTLESMDQETGAVIPPNIVPGKFAHYTADNIDILDETLNGKNTFHATQMAVWQRGTEPDVQLSTLVPSSRTSLDVPDVMTELLPAKTNAGKSIPVYSVPVEKSWFNHSLQSSENTKDANSLDLSFIIHRKDKQQKPGWTAFNQSIESDVKETTSLGYMPIILAPAHELDTLNTVVRRCLTVSEHLAQEHTVITVDQALYCKLMELKWSVPEYKYKLIPRLGGLHTSMNFLKVFESITLFGLNVRNLIFHFAIYSI